MFLNKYNIDILGISEANLNKTVQEYEYMIPNYKVFSQEKDMNRVIVYVKDNIDCKLEKD